ncbi:AbrB/MazE/SpoVT family DNA-binding domain-containing protein [Candidatus Shapirobacteria bacterium]|nr:AbrB/MazE/SpoVT family DNA-binding domain-containing protein [Candidatus Shapirobacteria bacterium]
MPIGTIVKPMERGQVTIPASLRGKLKITPETLLNVFEWKGMIVIVPVEFRPKTVSGVMADWAKDTPEEYLAKVRYNPLEELWARMARESW